MRDPPIILCLLLAQATTISHAVDPIETQATVIATTVDALGTGVTDLGALMANEATASPDVADILTRAMGLLVTHKAALAALMKQKGVFTGCHSLETGGNHYYCAASCLSGDSQHTDQTVVCPTAGSQCCVHTVVATANKCTALTTPTSQLYCANTCLPGDSPYIDQSVKCPASTDAKCCDHQFAHDSPRTICDYNMEPLLGRCFKFVPCLYCSATQALTACAAIGAKLVTVDTQEVWDLVYSRFQNVKTWIGGTDVVAEGTWVWPNGQPVVAATTGSTMKWGSAEPNGGTMENCMYFRYYMYDWGCDTHIPGAGYVCEASRVQVQAG